MSQMTVDSENAMESVSFVIPVYNERESIPLLIEEIQKRAGLQSFRVHLVDDGSTDGSDEEMRALSKRFPFIDVVSLEKHQGKSAALAAGFARAGGDVVVTMDSDLQDDPKEIPRFLESLRRGPDLVCGWKSGRTDARHRRIASRLYNASVARLFGLRIHDVNCGFKAMRCDVAKAVTLTRGMHRLIPVLAARRGFTVAEIPVTHRPRRFGKSKYGVGRYFRGAWDVAVLWCRVRWPGARV